MHGARLFLIIAFPFIISAPWLQAACRDNYRGMIPTSGHDLAVDGSLNDRIWNSAAEITLDPERPGVPAELGGKLKLVIQGNYLCLGAALPEPGGRVLARSIGYNPVWEKDAVTSPVVEDLLVLNISPGTSDSSSPELRIEINPWGAYRLERNERPVPTSAVLTAAGVALTGWSVECALALDELYPGTERREIRISVERFRARRPLDPEFIWKSSPGEENTWLLSDTDRSAGKTAKPLFKPPRSGDNDIFLRAGFVQAVPPAIFHLDDPFWKKVNGFRLLRNEPSPRNPEYPTEVKWVHDRKTLALLFHCVEDSRVDGETGARDGNISGDDHVFIYLATSGSSFAEIQINAVGAVRDALGRGPHMASTSSGTWTGEIQTDYLINSDAWYLRVNLPLDQIALALGETSVPEQWKILVGRNRRARIGETEEISSNPVVGNPYLSAPARFRRLELTAQDPFAMLPDPQAASEPALGGLAGELRQIDSRVFPLVRRKFLEITDMLGSYFEERIKVIAMQENEEWNKVGTLQQWEEFRDLRIGRLKKALGDSPREKTPLSCQESGSWRGDGYQVKNIAFKSRPGFYVAANLYLPAEPADKMPGIVIIPSHHYPKIQGELKDCGIVWARCGCAVLVLESLGYGERAEVNPWYRQPYQSESQLEFQLNLVGQNRQGWIAWDVSRAVDLLEELGNVDPDKLILIGSVTWGGGRPASIAGLLDERFDAVIPFNWGRVYWESYGIPGSVTGQITPWVTCAAIAPRKFVYAHEFSWEGEEGHSLPSISVPAWSRYNKVYNFYGAENNLRSAQGKGLLRVQETMGDCYSLGTIQRGPLYKIFNEWFNIPLPSEEDWNIELDSWLGFGGIRTDLELVRYKELQRRMPDSALLSITPQTDARIQRKALHELAYDIARNQLREARNGLSKLTPAERRNRLAVSLSQALGGMEPVSRPTAKFQWEKPLSGAIIEAIELQPEDGIRVPLLIVRPSPAPEGTVPVVICLAEGGKDRFLKQKSQEIERLIQKGIAVCLPDVRGTGETAPSMYNRGPDLSDRAMDLGETLLGLRLRDVRAVLSYVRERGDLDSRRIALWGESFSQANPENLWVDELGGWPVSPQVQYFASPLGANLSLLTALLDKDILAVAARGALKSYLSLLESNITYVPFDIVIPKVFEAGDISDICASLAPAPLLIEGVVDGRNREVEGSRLLETLSGAVKTYGEMSVSGNLIIRPGEAEPNLVNWLAGQLR